MKPFNEREGDHHHIGPEHSWLGSKPRSLKAGRHTAKVAHCGPPPSPISPDNEPAVWAALRQKSRSGIQRANRPMSALSERPPEPVGGLDLSLGRTGAAVKTDGEQ